MPRRCGKLKDLTKFDASFFGVHPKQANGMDPQLRMLLEVTYEALLDAGQLFFCIENVLTLFKCINRVTLTHWRADIEIPVLYGQLLSEERMMSDQ